MRRDRTEDVYCAEPVVSWRYPREVDRNMVADVRRRTEGVRKQLSERQGSPDESRSDESDTHLNSSQ